tara:strand:+ start:71 stop:382 length:312 start_codon:yes stop_codon:yes gene_type:complete
MSRVTFQPKLLSERVSLVFDFTSRLASGETISTATTTATLFSGTDSAPSSLIFGAAAISGQTVSQLVVGGVLGVTYELLCTITTSASQTLQLSGYLVVAPNLE